MKELFKPRNKKGGSKAPKNWFDKLMAILMTVCLLASITAVPAPVMAAEEYTASGTAMLKYDGPESALTSTGTPEGPVSVPISLGQTIAGSLDETDFREDYSGGGDCYIDEYQLAIDASQPFAVQVSGLEGNSVYEDVRYNVIYTSTYEGVEYKYNYMELYGYTSDKQARSPGSGFANVNSYSESPIDGGCSVHIVVYSTKKGNYTLEIMQPIAGAAVNLEVKDGTAKAPLPTMTSDKGAWSRSFDAASTYQASFQKDGYSFTPDRVEVNGASTALDFIGTQEDLPEITDLILDKDQGIAEKEEQTITATVYADAPDGTPVSVYLLDNEGASVSTRYMSDLIATGGSIYGGVAEIPLQTQEVSIAKGFYKVVAQLAGSSVTMSKTFTVVDDESVPKVTDVKITPDSQYPGNSQTIQVALQTENVPDNTKVDAFLTDSMGNPVEPYVQVVGKLIIGNQAAFSMNIPSSLAVGEYNLRITVNTAAPYVVNKPYTVKSGGNAITSFSVPGQTGRAVIDGNNHTVNFYVPAGTEVTSLTPTIGISTDATINPQSGVPQNFNIPVSYTVTSQDGTPQLWTVSCIKSALGGIDITAFSLTGRTEVASINTIEKTIDVKVSKEVDIEALTAAFTLSEGACAYISAIQQESGVTANDFTNQVIYTVIAGDGTSQVWTVNCTVDIQPGTGADFTAFSLPSQTGNAVIDAMQKSISVQFSSKTDISSLAAAFNLSAGAVARVNDVQQISGVTLNDFTNPIIYTITAEDGSQEQWTVNCTLVQAKSGKDFTAFGIAGQEVATTIDSNNKTIQIQMPAGSDQKALVASFALSEGASATVNTTSQVSGVTANDFSQPVTYTVIAEDGTTQSWTVNCTSGALAGTYSASGKVFMSATVFGAGGTSTGTQGGYTAVPIECGTTVNGAFTAASPLHSDKSHYALYSFNGVTGQKIKVSVSSGSFNPYVQLWNSSNPYNTTVLDKAQGTLGGAAAMLPSSGDYYTLPSTGTFYLFVSTYSAGETGAYTLNLEGVPQAGVTMTFTRPDGGVCPAAVQTGADGSWSQIGFETGAIYTVTPSYGDYGFPTTSRNFTVKGDTLGLNFTAMLPGIQVNAITDKNIIAGNTVAVNWAYLGILGTVKVEVLKGTTVIATAENQSGGSGGSGSYIWTIPSAAAVASDYAFRVTSDKDATVTSTSPAFSIAASGISLTNWTSGKQWTVGQTYNITWAFAGNASTTVKLELMDGASPVATIGEALNITQGTCAWTVPQGLDTSKTYSIRLTRSDTSATATGASLTIYSASFTAKGQIYEIVRNGSNFYSIPDRIDLNSKSQWLSQGGDWPNGTIDFNSSVSDAMDEFSKWHATGYYSKYYSFKAYAGQKIALNLALGSQFGDSADLSLCNYPDMSGGELLRRTQITQGTSFRYPETGYFTIPETGEYFIRINNANPGVAYTPDALRTFTLTLETAPVTDATVSFTKIGGDSASVVPEPVKTDANGYWSAEFVNGNTYRAGFQKEGYYFTPNYKDFLGGNFIDSSSILITDGAPNQGLVISSPNAGGVWLCNKSYDITWGYSGNANHQVAISLLKDGTQVASLQTTTAGTGKYTWTPSQSLKVGSGYQIQIKNLVTSSISYSGVFAIGTVGKVIASDHMLAGDIVPLGDKANPSSVFAPVQPLKSFNSYGAYGCSHYFYNTNADTGFYFQGKKGQILEVSGFVGASDVRSNFSVIQTDSSGKSTTLGTSETRNNTYSNPISWTFTIPADGTYILLQNMIGGNGNLGSFSNQFRAAIGIPGVTLQVIPKGGSETPYTVITDAYGDWKMLPQDSVGYSVSPIVSPDGNGYSYSPTEITVGGQNTSYIFIAEQNGIAVKAPAKGAVGNQGIGMDISWNYYGNPGSTVDIDLLKAGTFVKNIATGVAIGTEGSGSYTWNVPRELASGSDYSVQVTLEQNTQYSSVSGQFSIGSPLKVTAPTGGSAWSKGITRSISWNYGYADIGVWVKIELLKGGELVSTLSESCAAGASGVGSFDWTPSAELAEGTDYQVRVTSGTYPNITNVSGNFTLSGNFTAGGTVTIQYNGEASPITATNVQQSLKVFNHDGVYKFSTPVAVPVSLGETVRGTIDSADAQLKGYTDYGYFDEYQLVLDASQPFAIEAVMDDGSQPKMLVKFDEGNYKGGGYIGYSFPVITGRFPASGFQTMKDYSSSAQSVRVQIFSKTPGAYTAKFIGSLTGAAVNFSSETAVPPNAVIIGGAQPWSAGFTSGNVYGASATREGYTITPEVETFDGPRSDINFTAVKNTIPKIADLSLDKSSATFSIANTVTATINTENVPDGTPFLIRMINLQGGTAICPLSYSDNEEYGDLRKVIQGGTISNNQGTGTLTLHAGCESIPAGLYQICAQVAGSSVIVSKPFTILNEGSSAQIQSAEITPNSTYHGLRQTVNVAVKTLNVPDSTKISAVLTDSLGNRYNPEVSAANKVVIGNQANFSMNIPEVPVGSYNIQVTINTPVPITVNLAYTIKPYTVTFKNYDGKTVKLAQTEYLKAAEAPDAPLRAGYTFTGWDKSFNKVTSDMTVTAKYQINRYTVSFNTGEGSAVGSKTVNYNNKVAKPTDPTRAEYNFSGWCSDETLATQFDFNSAIKGDTVVYAKWTKIEAPKYTVTFVDYEGHTISTSLVEELSGAAAPATAEIPVREGYAFTGWDKTFDHVTANMTVTAQYEIRSYTVGFVVNGGSEVGSQTVVYNEKTVKPANPTKDGFIFAGWYSNEELTTAFDFNTAIKDNTVLYAKWSSITHTVSVTPNSAEGGTVGGGGTYEENASVTVTATANTDYSFVNWTEGGEEVSTNASYTFQLGTGDRTLIANFKANPVTHTVTVTPNSSDGGTVSGGGSYEENKSVTVTATAKEGYSFVNWTESGEEVSTNASYAFQLENGDRTLIANFKANPITHTVSVTPNPTDGGTVGGGGTYEENESITVTATAKEGYSFVNWTESGEEVSTNASYTFQLGTGDRTLIANFKAKPAIHIVSVTSNLSDGGTISGGGTYEENESVTVTATAKDGYSFVNWTESGEEVSTNASYTFQLGTGDRTLIANFKANPVTHTVNVTPNSSDGGTVSGGGTYEENESITVTATAKEGYSFVNWTESGEVVSTNASFTFQLGNGDRTLIANFKAKPAIHIVSVTPNLSDGGTVSGGGTYEENASITVTATAKDGYSFVNWMESGEEVSTNASYAFQLENGDRTLIANFKANPVTHTVTFKDYDGKILKTESVEAGKEATAPANPSRAGYVFTGWNTTFSNVTSELTVTAEYSQNSSGRSSGSSGSAASTDTTKTYQAAVSGSDITPTNVSVKIDASMGSAAIEIGSAHAGFVKDGGTESITMPSIPNVTDYTMGIPVPYLSTSDTKGALTLESDIGNITISSNMLTGTDGEHGSNAQITIGEGDKSILADEATKTAIGHKPLIQLTLAVDGKQIAWNNAYAPVTVSIPYTPTEAELANPENIVIWYIDGSGKAISVPNGHYDLVTGMVTFATTHFSYYAVGYNKVSFTDVAANAWFNKAVNYIAARGITTGTGNGNFSPQARLTRGEFLVMLMKAYAIAPDEERVNNFADAGSTYYTGYLAAAKRLGISGGIGNNMFAPDKEITRQEMFTLLYNALKVINKLPQGNAGKSLSNFSDAEQISVWAKDAMTLLLETGTVGGNDGKLTPTSATTRGEMAQVLYNLLSK